MDKAGVYHSLVNSKRMTVDDPHFIAAKKLAANVFTIDEFIGAEIQRDEQRKTFDR